MPSAARLVMFIFPNVRRSTRPARSQWRVMRSDLWPQSQTGWRTDDPGRASGAIQDGVFFQACQAPEGGRQRCQAEATGKLREADEEHTWHPQ
jgi:hypothetical protein